MIKIPIQDVHAPEHNNLFAQCIKELILLYNTDTLENKRRLEVLLDAWLGQLTPERFLFSSVS